MFGEEEASELLLLHRSQPIASFPLLVNAAMMNIQYFYLRLVSLLTCFFLLL